jgi:hypothetical protein
MTQNLWVNFEGYRQPSLIDMVIGLAGVDVVIGATQPDGVHTDHGIPWAHDR